jgi:hypothetical protein
MPRSFMTDQIGFIRPETAIGAIVAGSQNCQFARTGLQYRFAGAGSSPNQAVPHQIEQLPQSSYPCATAFEIMQWMPLEPFTVCVTRRSAARLQSV